MGVRRHSIEVWLSAYERLILYIVIHFIILIRRMSSTRRNKQKHSRPTHTRAQESTFLHTYDSRLCFT